MQPADNYGVILRRKNNGISYLTDAGQVRDHNEDSVTVVKNAAGEILMAVADGMGGHKAAKLLRQLRLHIIGKRFTDSSRVGTKDEAIIFLRRLSVRLICFYISIRR